VSVGERRVDPAMGLERPDPEVHRRRRVPDEHFRRVLSRYAIDRLVLGEPGEKRGTPPHSRRQRAVNWRVRIDTRNADRELPAAAAVYVSGGANAIGSSGISRRRRWSAGTGDVQYRAGSEADQ